MESSAYLPLKHQRLFLSNEPYWGLDLHSLRSSAYPCDLELIKLDKDLT